MPGPASLQGARAVSSVGRAPARQAGGHWFEPSTAHKTSLLIHDHRPAVSGRLDAGDFLDIELDISHSFRAPSHPFDGGGFCLLRGKLVKKKARGERC